MPARSLAGGAGLLLVVLASAASADSQPVAGLKLVLLDKYGVGKAKVVYVAKGSTGIHKGVDNDPPALAGSVEVFPLSDPANRAHYALPTAGWIVNKPTVAKYVDKTAAPGGAGAKVVAVKPGLLAKLVAKNLGDGDAASGDQSGTDLDLQALTPSDTIRVVVTIDNTDGTHVFCSDFSALTITSVGGAPFKVSSKTSAAPASCTDTSTTTTTTSTSTTSTVPACGSESGAFVGITSQHNATRAGASPTPTPPLVDLCWSDGVAAAAQAWADQCNWAHDPQLGMLGQGQNLYAAAISGGGFPATAAQDAEPAWAAEAADYDYATNTCSAVCGHYTQIVWRDTQVLGCGLKDCTTGSPFGPGFPNWTIVVCNYAPPGNVVGQQPY
jgi:pathogenesis-related protein 1